VKWLLGVIGFVFSTGGRLIIGDQSTIDQSTDVDSSGYMVFMKSIDDTLHIPCVTAASNSCRRLAVPCSWVLGPATLPMLLVPLLSRDICLADLVLYTQGCLAR
jgi:hypothetical protein